MMLEIDGSELCRKLKLNPHLSKIPFVFYTANYPDSEDGVNQGAGTTSLQQEPVQQPFTHAPSTARR